MLIILKDKTIINFDNVVSLYPSTGYLRIGYSVACKVVNSNKEKCLGDYDNWREVEEVIEMIKQNYVAGIKLFNMPDSDELEMG